MTTLQALPARVITVDGPSGTGKGTIAARLASLLGWHVLDTGALYRCVGLAAVQRGVALDDDAALGDLANGLHIGFDGERVLLDGSDVSSDIRTAAAGEHASRVAACPAVRRALWRLQREAVRPPGLVADGRDMGTVVFPEAEVKIYLDASPEVRVERRYKQLKEKGMDANVPDLARELAERDRRDRERSVSPMEPAADAVVIDTSSLGIEAVLVAVLGEVRRVLPDAVPDAVPDALSVI
ncbi:MAG: (d)CMP kinase [Thiohalocapsa sp.]|jgi:cytidylate kinase|uniref:(d)CMP kinase n=1 Tax=Thiohalocapsa sp. TaxID=2497641 RepID=UPI0025F0565E|nr:(d)CMP kinase [Thiohalocapsa sp.]MCG6942159.1 (d)CMP kinase [Thiohalocapsa sp.]